MDQEAEKQKLQEELKQWDVYVAHPITKKLLEENVEQQKAFVSIICDTPIRDMQSFFAHFAAVGHLGSLRDTSQLVFGVRDEIQEKLKEIKETK